MLKTTLSVAVAASFRQVWVSCPPHGSSPGSVCSRLPSERQLVPWKDRSSEEAAEETGGAGLHERAAHRAAKQQRGRWAKVSKDPEIKAMHLIVVCICFVSQILCTQKFDCLETNMWPIISKRGLSQICSKWPHYIFSFLALKGKFWYLDHPDIIQRYDFICHVGCNSTLLFGLNPNLMLSTG